MDGQIAHCADNQKYSGTNDDCCSATASGKCLIEVYPCAPEPARAGKCHGDSCNQLQVKKSSGSHEGVDLVKYPKGVSELRSDMVWVRQDLARSLLKARDYAGATEQFVSLWKNIDQVYPFAVSLHHSFIARDMTKLASTYQPAKDAFRALRDESEHKGLNVLNNLEDWINLNKVVGEQDKTLAWLDRMKKSDSLTEPLAKELVKMPEIRDVLIKNNRMDDLRLIYGLAAGSAFSQDTDVTKHSLAQVVAAIPGAAEDLYLDLLSNDHYSEADRFLAPALIDAEKRDKRYPSSKGFPTDQQMIILLARDSVYARDLPPQKSPERTT